MRTVMLLAMLGAACAASPERVLDDLHDAASKADGERYFALFAPDGVFLGTDASERWTVSAFRAYAEPYFSQGKGWTYRPRDRSVTYSDRKDVAWFDELLDNESYGELRGSGVLVKVDGEWRVAQYNLAFTIPNDRARAVVELLRR